MHRKKLMVNMLKPTNRKFVSPRSVLARSVLARSILLAASFTMALFASVAIGKEDNYISIVFVKGDVTLIQTYGAVSPPVKGTQVYSGDVIHTGKAGFISLGAKYGEYVNVQPDSQATIESVVCDRTTEKCTITLKTENGKFYGEEIPSAASEQTTQFSINTPYSSAAVRGPRFGHSGLLLTPPAKLKGVQLPDDQ